MPIARVFIIFSSIVVAFLASSPAVFADDSEVPGNLGKFVAFKTQVGEDSWPASVYVPPDYDPEKEWPLVVFLHGIGERGKDGVAQTEVGIGPAIRTNPDWFSCLVLMPQCAPSTLWSAPSNSEGASAAEHIDAAIDHVLDEFSVDTDRLLLTGLSMGGYGVFRYGARNVERFAALLPICGGGRSSDAEILAKRPMWVFHGGADPVVNPSQSRKMVEAIREAGGEVRYTEYPGVGHNSWDLTYNDREVIRWLLRQKR